MGLKETLRHHLRYVTIFSHFVVIIFCSCVFFSLGSVTNYFQSQCVLFSAPELTLTGVPHVNINATLDTARSTWGSPSLCNVCTYVPVVTAIHSFIWCWFYIQMQDIHDESQALCSLLISTILQGILCITQLVSSCIITLGVVSFCSELTSKPHDQYSCSETQNWNWETGIFMKKHKFYTFLITAVVFSWLVTVILLLQSITSGYFTYKVVDYSYTMVDKQPSLENFAYTNHQRSYSELSVDDDTGSLKFDVEYSHKTMNEQYEEL